MQLIKILQNLWALLSNLEIEREPNGLKVYYKPTGSYVLLKDDGSIRVHSTRHIHLVTDQALLLNCPSWQEHSPTKESIQSEVNRQLELKGFNLKSSKPYNVALFRRDYETEKSQPHG